MANYLYVDNSNVWIEGMHVSAVKVGIAPDIWSAMENNICDYGWKLEFGRLHEFAGGDNPARAILYGSRPPPNDSLWNIAKRKGFEVVVFDRSLKNKEKKIDTQITADIITDLYERMKREDEVTLVAGDKDYVPVCEKVIARGVRFDVVFWNHAAGELKRACTEFVNLNPHLDLLRLRPVT